MTTYGTQDVKCGNCGEESTQMTPTSIYGSGGNELDLRPLDFWRSTMRTWVQECPDCGHAAKDLEEPCDLSEILSDKVLAAMRAVEEPDLSGRFLRAAYIAKLRGDLPAAADHTLYAAWVIDDLGEDATDIRSRAADLMHPESDEDYLQLVDILRRARRWNEAMQITTHLLRKKGNIAKIAAFQERLIAKHDDKAHSIDEAFERK